MEKINIKRLLTLAAGGVAGYVSVFGCYPLGIAYFTSAYRNGIYRYFLFPVVLIGMAFKAPPIAVAKYGICMVVVMFLIWLAEKRLRTCPRLLSAFVAGLTLAAMGIADYAFMNLDRLDLLRRAAEGVLVISLAWLFDRVMDGLINYRQSAAEKAFTDHPSRQKVMEFSEALNKLAGTFHQMSVKRENLSQEEVDNMFQEVSGSYCRTCRKWEECWGENSLNTYQNTYDIWNSIETDGSRTNEELKRKLKKDCIRWHGFLEECTHLFQRAKMNLIWNNRLIDNREAVAEQLGEMAGIMTGMAEEVFEAPCVDEGLEHKIRMRLKGLRLEIQKIVILERQEERKEIHVTMRSGSGRCVATRDVERAMSKSCQKRMKAVKDSRKIVGREFCTVIFIEDVNFKILHSVARATKNEESVSGDNFSFTEIAGGQFIMSLSDGMGSGVNAFRESGLLIDLLEQFLEAGFTKETAIKMINSSLVMRVDNPYFSTIDISAVDLYSGVCEFLKIGASTTFIRRDNWVETITSTSLPAGVFHDIECDSITKKLYDGDFIIMVTDGVLDALPIQNQEERIRQIILEADTNNPRELANHILEEALSCHDGKPSDDMTVLVTGIWKK